MLLSIIVLWYLCRWLPDTLSTNSHHLNRFRVRQNNNSMISNVKYLITRKTMNLAHVLPLLGHVSEELDQRSEDARSDTLVRLVGIWCDFRLQGTVSSSLIYDQKARHLYTFQIKKRVKFNLRISTLYIDGILPKGPYPPCLRMAGRALLAGYPRYLLCSSTLLVLKPEYSGITKSIQSSVVITQSNLSWYYIRHCDNNDRKRIKY